jgi:hypothetical protein
MIEEEKIRAAAAILGPGSEGDVEQALILVEKVAHGHACMLRTKDDKLRLQTMRKAAKRLKRDFMTLDNPMFVSLFSFSIDPDKLDEFIEVCKKAETFRPGTTKTKDHRARFAVQEARYLLLKYGRKPLKTP